MKVLKVQTTLRGYDAWIVENLMSLKGQPLADVTNYIFGRWIDENADYLNGFGLDREKFIAEKEARGKVRSIDHTDAG